MIVYRLATKGTVEQTLLEKADGKRRLEKIVIHKDKFRGITSSKSSSSSSTLKRKNTTDEGEEEEDDDFAELRGILDQSDEWGKDDDTAVGDENANKTKGKGKGKQILSEDDLRILTDRSEAAYARAEKGEEEGAEGDNFRGVETKRDGGDVLLGRVA